MTKLRRRTKVKSWWGRSATVVSAATINHTPPNAPRSWHICNAYNCCYERGFCSTATVYAERPHYSLTFAARLAWEYFNTRGYRFGLTTTFIDEGTFKARVLAEGEKFPGPLVVDLGEVELPVRFAHSRTLASSVSPIAVHVST